MKKYAKFLGFEISITDRRSLLPENLRKSSFIWQTDVRICMARIPVRVAFMIGCMLFSIIPCLFLLMTLFWRTSSDADYSGKLSHIRQISVSSDSKTTPVHTLAVIVPFRDRYEAVKKFVPHMSHFLSRKNIPFEIFVVNQNDSLRFNRGSLINIGFLLAMEQSDKFDYLVMHDVDLMPLNDDLSYAYEACADSPFHIAAPHLHPRYHYDKFIGGILMMTAEQFRHVNGMSNKYYGWGWEDDELYVRLKRAGYKISRPPATIASDHTNTFTHLHDKAREPRDSARYFNQTERTKRLDIRSGLKNIAYRVVQREKLYMNNDGGKQKTAPTPWCWFISVQLICDVRETPWCRTPTKES